MEKRFGYGQIQSTGARVTGATVTVYLNGTLTLAQIFADNLATPLSNPFTADAVTGLWQFYAANGRYDVQLAGGSPTISPAYTLSDYLDLDLNSTVNSLLIGASLALNSSFTTISAGSIQEQTISLANALPSGIASISPVSDIGSGLIWSAWVSALNTVSVRLANVTTSPLTPNSVAWNVMVAQ